MPVKCARRVAASTVFSTAAGAARHPAALGTWCYFRFRLSKVAGFLPHPELGDAPAIEPGDEHVREQDQRKYGKCSEKHGRYV